MITLDEPGELPLMREVSAHRKSRGAHDPSAKSTWKPPVLEAKSFNAENTTVQDKFAEADSRVNSHMIRRGPLRSPQQKSSNDPRLSWDSGRDSFIELDPKDEAMGWSNCGQDGETSGRFNCMKNRGESSLPQSYAECKRYALLKDDHGSPAAADRIKKGVRKPNVRTLSPLVLNSVDDGQRFDQSRSVFSLEDACKEEGQSMKEKVRSHRMSTCKEALLEKPGLHCYPPLISSKTYDRKQTSSVMASPAQAFMVTEVDNGFLQSTHELVKSHVNPLDLSHKGDGVFYSKKQNPRKGKLAGQSTLVPAETSKVLGVIHRSAKQTSSYVHKVSISGQYQTGNPNPPIPLEVGSESDGAASSEESYRLSTSELHGELDIEAFTSLGEQHAGTLVKAADSERLQLAVPECKELASCEDRPRNLSQKYRPKAFAEIVGQSIVAQALSNAVMKRRIAPVYLFQGPRGTGKTSAARIFAAALVCAASPDIQRPCSFCKGCISALSGRSSDVKEVDAASNNGIGRVKDLLGGSSLRPSVFLYRVFIIDECHMLTSETWNALLKVLEEPPTNVVFILITTDPDQLPRTTISRCQKFPFPKIKESEIVKRLQKLANLEGLELDAEILHLIASRSDGSLRDAETILDQLSVLGQKIDQSIVYELVGSASDERMVNLLDSALLADTVNTVQQARELVDCSIEPLSLMSRLATLIMDILAGSYKFSDNQRKGFFRRQVLSEDKLERLRRAIKILSEAEKQLRASNDKATWLIAALLQLGPERSYMFPPSANGTSVTQSPVPFDDVIENKVGDFQDLSAGLYAWEKHADSSQKSSSTSNWETVGHEMLFAKSPEKLVSVDQSMGYNGEPEGCLRSKELPDFDKNSLPSDRLNSTMQNQILSPGKLDDIWSHVLQGCRPLRLREWLCGHGKLLSVSLTEVNAVVHLEFSDVEHKSRSERYGNSISNAFEAVLGSPVDVKFSLAALPADEDSSFRTWAPIEQCKRIQGSPAKDFVSDNNRVHSEEVAHVDSLISWEKHGVELRGGVRSSTAADCFPAIPHAASGSMLKDIECLRMEGSQSNDMAAHPLEGNAESAWPPEAVRFSVSSSSASCGNTITVTEMQGETMQQNGVQVQYASAHEGMSVLRKGYRQELKNKGPKNSTSKKTGEADDLYIRSPNSGTEEGTHIMQGCLGSHYSVDGPRSSDASSQKGKGSTLKMVRRLTMRGRNRTLASSSQESPAEDKNNAVTMNRFLSVGHKKAHENDGSRLSDDETDPSDQVLGVEEATMSVFASSQKKHRIKGAAGSVARFFQGFTKSAD